MAIPFSLYPSHPHATFRPWLRPVLVLFWLHLSPLPPSRPQPMYPESSAQTAADPPHSLFLDLCTHGQRAARVCTPGLQGQGIELGLLNRGSLHCAGGAGEGRGMGLRPTATPPFTVMVLGAPRSPGRCNSILDLWVVTNIYWLRRIGHTLFKV